MDIAENLKLDKCSYSNVCIIRMTGSRLSIQFRNGYILLQSMYIAGGVLICTYVHNSNRVILYLPKLHSWLSRFETKCGMTMNEKESIKIHSRYTGIFTVIL